MRVRRVALAGLLLASSTAAIAREPAFVPVLRENFPDAFVMPEGDGSYVAYARAVGTTGKAGPTTKAAFVLR